MPNVELKRGQEVKEDAFEIRRRVFMEEQGYTDEFDDIDDTCIHIVLYKEGEPVPAFQYILFCVIAFDFAFRAASGDGDHCRTNNLLAQR